MNSVIIKTTGLSKVYRLGTIELPVLHDVNLQIQSGQLVCIVGPSGSGKSTLMNLLGCLDTPTSGEYFLEDRKVSGLPDSELARIRNRRIGFVFQTFNLLPRISALENVMLPLFYAGTADPRPAARTALERVGLADRVNHRPTELSGGECQRVAIARAIINQPAIILADEPTGNLDSRTGQEILKIFKELNEQGVTVILVTHDQQVSQTGQRVIRMVDGRIVKDEILN